MERVLGTRSRRKPRGENSMVDIDFHLVQTKLKLILCNFSCKVDHKGEYPEPEDYQLTELETSLFKACFTGDLAGLKDLLGHSPTITEALAFKGRLCCCYERHWHIVCYLERRWQAILEVQNLRLMLQLATERGHVSVVEFLLKFAYEQDVPYATIIGDATLNSIYNSANVGNLLHKFLDVDPLSVYFWLETQDELFTLAIRKDDIVLARLLLDRGICQRHIPGNDPSCRSFVPACGKQCPFSSSNESDVWDAAVRANPKMLKTFLESGVNVLGRGGLHALAPWEDLIKCMEILYESGASVDDYGPLWSWGGGQSWSGGIDWEGGEVILGGSVSWGGGVLGTPLHEAVRLNSVKSVVWLLEHGADVVVKDQKGNTAIDYAVSGGNEEMREVLEEWLEDGGEGKVWTVKNDFGNKRQIALTPCRPGCWGCPGRCISTQPDIQRHGN